MKNQIIIAAILTAGACVIIQWSLQDAGETARRNAIENTEKFNSTVDRVAARKALPRLKKRVDTLREELRDAKGPGEAALLGRDLDEAMAAVDRAEREAER